MKAFLFSLDGAAKDWLYLQPVMFNTWEDMKWMFLEKFFLASRTATVRKEICGIRKHLGETLHEYWESCVPCVRTTKSENNFCYSLLMMDHNIVNAASGGALMDKTPVVARHLISNMASNMQQFGTRGGAVTLKVVSEVGAFNNLRLENQLMELTSLVRQLVVGQHQQNA
ncbi:hypothetical protein CR513_43986, partial [Mucuna pruriens]